MTGYRFRIKYDPDPTSLWRDIEVGADRTVDEFQTAINSAVGLDQDHLWFVGEDEQYWNSDIKYQSPQEFEELPQTPMPMERIENAGETSIGELTRQMGVEQYDRISYLYDYGEEWRFYGILKAIDSDTSSTKPPEVVNRKGEPLDQYGADSAHASLPKPLPSVLPETAVPVTDLRALEERDAIVHVLVLHSLETGFGRVADRFMVAFESDAYLLENFQPGWEIVTHIDCADLTGDELLDELAQAAREWHEEIAEISGAFANRVYTQETIEAMHVELEAELERKGYGDR